jgi:hypothetical protein
MSPKEPRRKGAAAVPPPPDEVNLDLFDEEGVRGMVLCADQGTRPATEAESLAGQLPGRRRRRPGPGTRAG